MAHTLTAKRNIRSDEKRRIRNKSIKTGIRSEVKNVLRLVAAKKKDEAAAALKEAYRLFDRAVTKGVLHRNHVARHKSRLGLKVSSL